MGDIGRTWRRARPEDPLAARIRPAHRRPGRRGGRLRVARTERKEEPLVRRPDGMNAFEFAVLSSLRATQLSRGCSPRVPASAKVAVTAQCEVAERQIVASPRAGTSDPVE
jgi:DNA-directed RNA polymerase subunit K/omega